MLTKPSAKSGSSQWIKCISTQGNVRGVAIQATAVVQELAEIHGLKGPLIQRLGEAVMGALLIASYCKGKEKVNLNIRSSGQVFQALVDAYPDGTVRGYVVEQSDATLPKDGIVFEDPSRGPWGEGLLSILRTQHESREKPYIGTVPLVTGHLAKDLTFYWVQSEQIPSAVGLAVELSPEGKVLAAGGFLVQALPGASAQEIRAIEEHISEIQSLAERLEESSEPIMLLSQIFQDTAFIVVEEKPLTFKCRCSWDRVKRALTLVGAAELKSMLNEDQGASIRCDFCTTDYRLDAEGLKELIAAATRNEG